MFMREKKVNFIIIGAQKCGTTSLAWKLKNHPQVCFCDRKEPNYFRVSYRKSLDWYHSLFDPTEDQILGEASVRYTYDSILRNVQNQIFDYNPEMKFIYIVRHPFERMISLYTDFQIRGEKVNKEFASEVMSRPEYILMSRYYTQIKPYLDLFNHDQFLFLNFNDLATRPEVIYKSISDFLDIDFSQFELENEMQRNKSKNVAYPSRNIGRVLYSPILQNLKFLVGDEFINLIKSKFYNKTFTPSINENEFKYIMSFLESDIDKMEILLNWDLSSWKNYKDFSF